MSGRLIAVIGSFRQHNAKIQDVCRALRAAGATVTSPRGAELVEEGIEFVRFQCDKPDWSDAAIQSLALHRIFAAGLVYVVAPGGYIGRTTCYEIGRVVHTKKPIYFSERPIDLPLHVPEQYILDISELVGRITDSRWNPTWLYDSDHSHAGALERDLLDGRLCDE